MSRALRQIPTVAAPIPRICEQLITEGLRAQLNELAKRLPIEGRPLSSAPTSGSSEFLHESGLDLDDVYDGSKGWSDLQEAGVFRCSRATPTR